jgi:hypothetical protein
MNLTLAHRGILAIAARYRGWGYGGYRVDGRSVDCVGLTAGVLAVRRGLDPADARTRSSPWWAAMAIWRGQSPWSPIHQAVADGSEAHAIGPADTLGGLRPGAVHLCQAWRALGPKQEIVGASRGHGFFWLASEDNPLLGWVLESASAPTGPRLFAGPGQLRLSAAIDASGAPLQSWAPTQLSIRVASSGWTDVGWAVLN